MDSRKYCLEDWIQFWVFRKHPRYCPVWRAVTLYDGTEVPAPEKLHYHGCQRPLLFNQLSRHQWRYVGCRLAGLVI